MVLKKHTLPPILLLLVVLLPTNNNFILLCSQLVVGFIILIHYRVVDKQMLVASIFFTIVLIGSNILGGDFDYKIFKPILSLFTIVLLSGYIRNFPPVSSTDLLKVSNFIMAGAVILFFIPGDSLEYMFRGDGADRYHKDRVTSPFLFAGDLGFFALLLAIATFRNSGATSKSGILVALATQSKLAYIGLLVFSSYISKIRYVILISFIIVFLFYWLDLFKYVFHIYNFVFNFTDYLADSKRSREYIWVFNNFDAVFFHGTTSFTADGFSADVESSLLSYIVKVGVFPTFLYWLILWLFFRSVQLKIFWCIALLFSLFAAPLDRPKLIIAILLFCPAVRVAECNYTNEMSLESENGTN